MADIPQDSEDSSEASDTESSEVTMTETAEFNIAEALALLDQGLSVAGTREMMTASEVSDLLLDIRMLLAAAAVAETKQPAAVGS